MKVRQPLPFTPAPQWDELLSSWFRRLAKANRCSTSELVDHLQLEPNGYQDISGSISFGDVERIVFAARLDEEQVMAMKIPVLEGECAAFLSERPFQTCPVCTRLADDSAFERRHWRFAWSLRCIDCGSFLMPVRTRLDDGEVTILESGSDEAVVNGARYLREAVLSNDRPVIRRTLLLLNAYMRCSKAASSTDALLFGEQKKRHSVLKMIAHMNSYPLAKAAWLLGPVSTSPWRRLEEAFPEQDRLTRLLKKTRAKIERRLAGRLVKTNIVSVPGIEAAYVLEEQRTLRDIKRNSLTSTSLAAVDIS